MSRIIFGRNHGTVKTAFGMSRSLEGSRYLGLPGVGNRESERQQSPGFVAFLRSRPDECKDLI